MFFIIYKYIDILKKYEENVIFEKNSFSYR